MPASPHTVVWHPQVSGLFKKSTNVVMLLFVFLCAKESVSPVEQCSNKPQHARGDERRAEGGIMQGKGEAMER